MSVMASNSVTKYGNAPNKINLDQVTKFGTSNLVDEFRNEYRRRKILNLDSER